MPFQDKTLTCVDCGQPFVFTAGEQEFYAQKGFQNAPKRCKAARPPSGRAGPAQAGRGWESEMFEVVCSSCGQKTTSRSSRPPIAPCTAGPVSSRGGRPGFARSHPPRHISVVIRPGGPPWAWDPPGLICFPHHVIAPREGKALNGPPACVTSSRHSSAVGSRRIRSVFRGREKG